jgi:hypothetical protein
MYHRHTAYITSKMICLEDGTYILFRNVGQYKPDAGKHQKIAHWILGVVLKIVTKNFSQVKNKTYALELLMTFAHFLILYSVSSVGM